MKIIYPTTPVCVSFLRYGDCIAYANGWQELTHHYYRRSYIGADLFHIKYIKRNGNKERVYIKNI